MLWEAAGGAVSKDASTRGVWPRRAHLERVAAAGDLAQMQRGAAADHRRGSRLLETGQGGGTAGLGDFLARTTCRWVKG